MDKSNAITQQLIDIFANPNRVVMQKLQVEIDRSPEFKMEIGKLEA